MCDISENTAKCGIYHEISKCVAYQKILKCQMCGTRADIQLLSQWVEMFLIPGWDFFPFLATIEVG